ncbi:MAG: hypothetical protein PHV93_00665 [Candidatus Pacebacteria bacterium]|nr:hypothetical protein [Candidatus Paceibacterota bacterium]
MKEHSLNMRKNKEIQTVFSIFIILTLWRVALFLFHVEEGQSWSFWWGATYQIIALWGGIRGLMASRAWGGHKSKLGRLIIAFSIGLLFQVFGQTVSSYFVYTTGDIPYPSLGDLGFFGSIPFYMYGVFLLAQVSGVSFSLKKNITKQTIAFGAFLAMIFVSYLIFLNGQQFDWSDRLGTFLNIAYPLTQAGYVALAILTYLLSRKYLGGMMKIPILLFLAALVIEYLSDFTFLYQAVHNLYIPEGINDYMYCVAYFIMAIALISVSITFNKIRES